jgi:hypothetical protein
MDEEPGDASSHYPRALTDREAETLKFMRSAGADARA